MTAGFVVPADVAEVGGLEVAELHRLEQAAVLTHQGEMTEIGDSWQALLGWVGEHDYDLIGAGREIYLTLGDRPQSEWVTELVQPVTARSA